MFDNDTYERGWRDGYELRNPVSKRNMSEHWYAEYMHGYNDGFKWTKNKLVQLELF